MKTLPTALAFPVTTNADTDTEFHEGMNKREYMATHILTGLIAKYNLKEPADQQIVSQMAVELADSLIEQLNK